MKRYLIITLASLVLIASSCRTHKQTSTHYLRDTVYVNHNSVQRDSIFVMKYDSVIVRTSGDTIFVERFHTDFKDRFLTKIDTLYKYQERIDYKDVVREKLVDKPLSWWQKVLIWTGAISLILILLFLLYKLKSLCK